MTEELNRISGKITRAIVLNFFAMLLNGAGFLITLLALHSPLVLFFFFGLIFNLILHWILT